MLLQQFEGLSLSFFINVGKQSFFNTKAVRLSIIKKKFLKIIRHLLTNRDELNIDIAFEIEWVSLIPIGK